MISQNKIVNYLYKIIPNTEIKFTNKQFNIKEKNVKILRDVCGGKNEIFRIMMIN